MMISVDNVKTPSPSPPDSLHDDSVQRLGLDNKVKTKFEINEDGTPPAWIKKFALSYNLNLDDDVKLTDDVDTRFEIFHLFVVAYTTHTHRMSYATPSSSLAF